MFFIKEHTSLNVEHISFAEECISLDEERNT